MPPYCLFSLELPGQYYSTTCTRTKLYCHTHPTEGCSQGSTLIIFFDHIPQLHTLQLTTDAHCIFFLYMIFECCHNIQNQPISTATPSPNSFRDITMIEKHQHLSKIHKEIFSDFSPRQYGN